MGTQPAELPGHEVKAAVSSDTICHDAWCSGVAPLYLWAWGRRSKVQSKCNITGSEPEPPYSVVYPCTYLTFLTVSLCEIMLHSALPQPLKHTRTWRGHAPPTTWVSRSDQHECMYPHKHTHALSLSFSLLHTHTKIAWNTFRQWNMCPRTSMHTQVIHFYSICEKRKGKWQYYKCCCVFLKLQGCSDKPQHEMQVKHVLTL